MVVAGPCHNQSEFRSDASEDLFSLCRVLPVVNFESSEALLREFLIGLQNSLKALLVMDRA
jgi:hypothetical protein